MGIIKKAVSAVGSIVGVGGGGGGSSAPDQAAVQQAQDAQKQATDEANRIAAEAAQRQAELNTMNKNFAADLSTENRTMVETAGSASDAAAVDNPDQKRKRPAAGLASTLGINV